MFSDARKIASKRKSIAIDCKNLIADQSPTGELPNGRVGLLATDFTPVWLPYNGSMRDMCDTPAYGPISGGGWTNGFALMEEGFTYKWQNANFTFPHKAKLLDLGERVHTACTLFHIKNQRTPILSFSTGNRVLLFIARHFDALLTHLWVRKYRDPELYFNSTRTGVVFAINHKPVIYLGKAYLPEFLEPLMIAHSEKFYANCGNRPQPD